MPTRSESADAAGDAGSSSVRERFALDGAAEDWWEHIGGFIFLKDPCVLDGRQVELRVELLGDCGPVAIDRKRVLAEL